MDEFCGGVQRNQVCYGNVLIDAEAQQNVSDFVFETSGDLVNVNDISTLSLSRMNVEREEWGVAMMQVQANLPNALAGQNVNFLLFGDAQIENAVEPTESN